jgi:hypothetical protein
MRRLVARVARSGGAAPIRLNDDFYGSRWHGGSKHVRVAGGDGASTRLGFRHDGLIGPIVLLF